MSPSATPTSRPSRPRWRRPSARTPRTSTSPTNHFISPLALDTSRLQVESARAQVAAAEAAADSAHIALRDASLVAPISGIVSKRAVVPGEKVTAEQPVVTIVDLHLLELVGTVGTQEVAKLAPGMTAQVRIEGVDQPVQGKLARIAPAAEAGTRSIGVVVQLQNPKETLRAGQYAVGQVTIGDAQPRLTVPLGAVGSASGQEYVWTIEDGKLLRRTVVTGRHDALRGRTEILEGLKPEAFVLNARFDNLKEGAKARVVASATANTPQPVAPAAPAASAVAVR